MLYHVVAMDRNRVIGKGNRLPWHFSSDLRHFKKLTMGGTLVMGRKTFESIGKPLPERPNFVLSRSAGKDKAGVRFFADLEQALLAVATRDAFIIGGGELFRKSITLVDGIYVTKIAAEYDGDVFYPEIPAQFRPTSRHRLQENPGLDVIFYENTAHAFHDIER